MMALLGERRIRASELTDKERAIFALIPESELKATFTPEERQLVEAAFSSADER
jgi:hypothetical protein